MKALRLLGFLLVGGALFFAGLNFEAIKERIVPTAAEPVDPEAALASAWGGTPELRLSVAGGLVLLSPESQGQRQVGHLAQTDEGFQLVGSKMSLPSDGAAELAADAGLVVIKTLKAGAPQFAAFRVGASGLEPVDYYALKAPEPSVKQGHHLVVNTQWNVLWHYKDGSLVKTYRVATGRQHGPPPSPQDWRTNFTTPVGDFTLINFMVNPPYTSAVDGRVVPGGDPENPLGTRWMGFSAIPGIDDLGGIYAIHGTNAPETVGTWASEGCIRMLTPEVEELFAILQERSPTLRVVAK